MKVSEFSGLVERVFNDSNHAKLAVLALGLPGIGKTQVPMDIARRLGWGCEGICMPLVNPTFLMGYPYRENGHADHAPFGSLSRLMKSEGPCVGILDDLGAASGETCKSALRLLQFREVCGKPLPAHVRLIALSNDVGHGITIEGLIEPMKDRFVSIINVEPAVDDTVRYGLAKGWPAWELAYIRNNPEALHDCKPLKSMQRSGATPRGWEGVAALDAGGYLDLGVGAELIQGAVGKGQGAAAMAFRGIVNELPDVDAALMDPEHSLVPENPSAKWLVSMALAGKMNGANFGRCVKYLSRLPQMFRAFSIRDAIKAEDIRREDSSLPKGYAAIHSSLDFTAWANSTDGQEIILAGKQEYGQEIIFDGKQE
jgi:hypothetical protein